MVVVWWIYVIIVVLLFFFLLIGHLIIRKINETRLEERLERQRARTTVSAQTSFILDRNAKRTDSKNLKEDKRTCKSLSLLGDEKSLAHTDLRVLITNEKQLNDTQKKSNLQKQSVSLTTAFSAAGSSSKEWSKVCMQDIPNSELHLIKNVSSTKGDVSFRKSDEVVKSTIKDMTLPSDKDYKNIHNYKELITPKDSHKDIIPLSLELDASTEKYIKEFLRIDESSNDVLPSVNYNRSLHDNNEQIITSKDSQKYILPSIKADERTDKNKSIKINGSSKGVLAALKYDKSVQISKEFIRPKDSHQDIKPSLLNVHENIDKNKVFIKINDSSKDIPPSIKVDNNKEFIKAKESIPNIILKSDENINKKLDEINRTKDVLLSLNTDKSNEITNKVLKEPSSLFFGTLSCTPSTPKEMFDPYENAFTSETSSNIEVNETKLTSDAAICALRTKSVCEIKRSKLFEPYENALTSEKSSKIEATVNEPKLASDAALCTSRTKSVCEIKRSKENITSSVSRVIFNPETKTSYIDVIEDLNVSKLETGISKHSITNKLNELTQTKDNVSKCTSRVTFAKNAEIVITDSVSVIDHNMCLCVVTPPTPALASDGETMCSNEFDVESVSNSDGSTTTKSNDDTKESLSPFQRSFISESVTVTNSIYRSNTTQTVEKDKYNDDLEAWQTSIDLHSGNKSEWNVLCPIDSFDNKLLERLAIVVKDEASTSRSLSTVIKNEASTTNNKIDSEVIIINNKFSGDTEHSRRKAENTASENVDDLKKEELEIEEKLDAMSLDELNFKLGQDDTKTDAKNKADDNNEDAGN